MTTSSGRPARPRLATPILHLVLIKTKKTAAQQEVESVLDAMERLGEQIRGVTVVAAGEDVSVEELAGGYTHAMVARFADDGVRARYLRHPAHTAVVEQLEPLLENIAIVDLPVIDETP